MFKTDRGRHYIMIKGSVQKENTTVLSIYAPKIGAPKYIKQVLTNIREKLTVTIKVGTFDTSLITLDRSSRQKINEETPALNDTSHQKDIHSYLSIQIQICSRSVASNSLQPHGQQPTRLLCPWNFPGKNTGVGCHFSPPGDFPYPAIEPVSPTLQADSLPAKSSENTIFR